MSVPAILLMPRGMRGVSPCSLGTVNAGAHNTIDAQRHVGEPYHMRVNGAHNTVEKMLTPTTLFGLCCAREVGEYCFYKCAEYGPQY